MTDKRNVADEFKHKPVETIIMELDTRGVSLEIAIENTLRDYNMGTIVRNANAFGVRHVHVIGKKQWNKRGAMATDKYLHVHYHGSIDSFIHSMKERNKTVIAIENNVASAPLATTSSSDKDVLVFGQEGQGISDELLAKVDKVVHIEQLGSTRSINVGVASGIAIYHWLHR